MVNVIIYSRDFEPITCIDLPIDIITKGRETGKIRLGLNSKTDPNKKDIILLDCYELPWFDKSTRPVFVTQNEEDTLVLKPGWLPGQVAAVHFYEQTIHQLRTKLKLKPKD